MHTLAKPGHSLRYGLKCPLHGADVLQREFKGSQTALMSLTEVRCDYSRSGSLLQMQRPALICEITHIVSHLPPYIDTPCVQSS